jgi:DNA modification methylase
MSQDSPIKIRAAKGRPMLNWLGKTPIISVRAVPAQKVERYDRNPNAAADGSWAEWPSGFERGGLLLHGDNAEALSHLLTQGFRGKIALAYIDPPFDSGADYVRRVSLRGPTSTVEIDGQGYDLGEQLQYVDIWANDNYLQFLFERLILIRELLKDNGSIVVHCDWHKSHHIRCMLDEVFGADSHVKNEIVWQRTDPHNDAKGQFGRIHDTLFWYAKGDAPVYNWAEVVEPLSPAALKEYSLVRTPKGRVVPYSAGAVGRRFKLDDCTWKGKDPTRKFTWRGARPSDKRTWPYASAAEMNQAVERGEFYLRNRKKGAARCRVSYLDESSGQLLQSIWTECGRMKGGTDYPTEKPYALLSRIVRALSNPGDIVLDCFSGSGTTLVAAQEQGRRWIGCDINKAAIQLTCRRIQDSIARQLPGPDEDDVDGAVPKPSQLGYSVFRVNDYDRGINHAETVEMVASHLGFDRTRSDSCFDGVLDGRLVKVIPFDHPLDPVDLEAIRDELSARPNESRNLVLVSLDAGVAALSWIDEWNRLRRGIGSSNFMELIELRTDPKHGGLFLHEPPSARVSFERLGDDSVAVVVDDFVSPTVIERLRQRAGVLQPNVEDWRWVVESVAIDWNYNGETLDVAMSDDPESRSDLVQGRYVSSPGLSATRRIAVRITDVLGYETVAVGTA